MNEPAAATLLSPARHMRWRPVLLVAGPLLLLAFVGTLIFWPHRFLTSENAYLKAGKVQVTADVSGRVTALEVDDNDAVRAGDVLFRIDPARYEIARDEAAARLGVVAAELAAMQARYGQVAADLESARADLAYAERERERQAALARSSVTSASRLDEAETTRRAAAARVAGLEEALAAVRAALGGTVDAPVDRHPRYRAALAALHRAELDLKDTIVRAPADGVVTQLEGFRPGDHVELGKPLFVLVETKEIWVEVNLKETLLHRLAPGQPARVRIDAYPDRDWEAEVASLSPGTGSEFAILPPQNALGNWVKVTQRVPVRLRLVRRPDDPPLRIGMSASVRIDTGPGEGRMRTGSAAEAE
ncbi:MAG: HlyD family secretion protein [Alphaproteobacteria bacterium]|nr:HlyD family secretion protein [Alphaproteobacteria bacterium]